MVVDAGRRREAVASGEGAEEDDGERQTVDGRQ